MRTQHPPSTGLRPGKRDEAWHPLLGRSLLNSIAGDGGGVGDFDRGVGVVADGDEDDHGRGVALLAEVIDDAQQGFGVGLALEVRDERFDRFRFGAAGEVADGDAPGHGLGQFEAVDQALDGWLVGHGFSRRRRA